VPFEAEGGGSAEPRDPSATRAPGIRNQRVDGRPTADGNGEASERAFSPNFSWRYIAG